MKRMFFAVFLFALVSLQIALGLKILDQSRER